MLNIIHKEEKRAESKKTPALKAPVQLRDKLARIFGSEPGDELVQSDFGTPIEIEGEVPSTLEGICERILVKAGSPVTEWESYGGHVIVGLVRTGRLTPETTIALAKRAFKRNVINDPALVPFKLDLKELLDAVLAAPKVVSEAERIGMIDKLEIARVYLRYGCCLGEGRVSPSCEKFLSQSFERLIVLDAYESKGAMSRIWCKYLTTAIQFCEHVPQSLVEFAVSDRSRRCFVTNLISNLTKKYRRWTWATPEDKSRFVMFAAEVLNCIIDADEDDYVALWELAELYISADRMNDALDCLDDAMDVVETLDDLDQTVYCRLWMSKIKCLECKCKDAALRRDKGRSKAIAKRIYAQYKDLIAQSAENDVPNEGFMQGFVRFQKNRKNYRGAYETAKKMPDGYRKFLELGMIHSSGDLKHDRKSSELLDYAKAVDCYARAWEFLEQEEEPVNANQKMSVLFPMASALKSAGRDRESYEVCLYSRHVKRESKIESLIEMLERTGDMPSLKKTDVLPKVLCQRQRSNNGC